MKAAAETDNVPHSEGRALCCDEERVAEMWRFDRNLAT